MGARMLPERMGFGQRAGPRCCLSIPAGNRNIPNLQSSPSAPPDATRSPDPDRPPCRGSRRQARPRPTPRLRRQTVPRPNCTPCSRPNGSAGCARTRSQATYLGDHRFDDRWPDVSAAALEKKHAGDVAVLETLRSIPAAQLSSEDQLNQELFRRLYQGKVDAYAWGLQYLPITQRSGVQTAAETARTHPVRDREGLRELDREARRPRRLRGPDDRADARGHATRTRAAEGDHAARPGPDREADRRGSRPPARSTSRSARCRRRSRRPSRSGCVPSRGLRSSRRSCPRSAGCRISSRRSTCRHPASRSASGTCRVAKRGTRIASAGSRPPNLTADEIHEIGLKEVARIRGEMQKIIQQVGFKGDLPGIPAFHAHGPALSLHGPAAAARGLPRHGEAHRPAAAAVLRHAAAHALRSAADSRRVGARHDDRVLQRARARRAPRRLLLREPLQARGTADLRDPGADDPRGRPGPSPADRARAGTRLAAEVPPRLRGHRLRRGLGALQREPRRGNGPVRRPVRQVRPADLRDVARGPAGGGHRHAPQALDARPGDPVLQGERPEERARHRQRDRPLHLLARPGARLQDRRAEDQGAAGVSRRRRRARTSTCAQFHDVVLGSGAIPLDVLEGNVKRWIDERARTAQGKP